MVNGVYLVTGSVLFIAFNSHVFSVLNFSDELSEVRRNANLLNHSPQSGKVVYGVNLGGRQYQIGFPTSGSYRNFWYSHGGSRVDINQNVFFSDNVRMYSGSQETIIGFRERLRAKNLGRDLVSSVLSTQESELAYVTNLFLLNEYLDALDAKEIIEKDGQTIEIFIIHQRAVFTESYNGQMASYGVVYKGETPLEIRQDGYYGEAGDSVSATFTIGRFV